MGHWSLVIGHWSLVISHWSLVRTNFLLIHELWLMAYGLWLMLRLTNTQCLEKGAHPKIDTSLRCCGEKNFLDITLNPDSSVD